ncbi:hypothetical protein LTS18_008171 [Coniosporium uncinatum]|uniref:Uncharacterized protein n=1 Tax=Coniosporium uncinatum TaxID=93489 RepID=A0ACC3D1Y6_9PEZI|nr:hypothetical protein LTS18_008171 [Coniosporium uncinatum]
MISRIQFELTQLFTVFLTLTSVALAAISSPSSTLTLYAWPLDASSPTTLGTLDTVAVKHQASQHDSLQTTLPAKDIFQADLSNFSPSDAQSDKYVRIGWFDGSAKDLDNWRGTLSSAAVLANDKGLKRRLVVNVDEQGEVFSVGLQATLPQGRKAGDEDFEVEVVKTQPGPKPALNRPVKLNAEGKVEGQPKGEEKSFLQKYWWAIALFLLVQVVAGGGGKE